jgi:hypothetical protein
MSDPISTVLHDHAEGDVHVERLINAVHAGARRHRQRRLAAVGSAVIVVAALVGITGAMSSRQASAPVADPAPDAATLPRPPSVVGAPTAARSPGVLGSDLSLFHLDLTGLTGWSSVTWAVRTGHEELTVWRPSGGKIQVDVDRSADRLGPVTGETWPTTVNARPATGFAATGAPDAVRWQPVPGVWAQVQSSEGFRSAADVAAALRLNHVYRCAVPFRLTGLTGVRLIKCESTYADDPATGGWTPTGGVWLKSGTGLAEYYLAMGRSDRPFVANATIGGRQVQVVEPDNGSEARFEAFFPSSWRFGYVFVFYDPVDQGVVAALVAGFTPVEGQEMTAWPNAPFD